ncbi:hypothetical protein LUZ62_077921 [Rhynchospora pubera]|uniref:IQ domain-containing protein IQM2-like n=1 Tax=Rhynchospora pubera TaxID=906938 RepID=A0AAV8DMT1_9POAL|nr:hypothetical protein LUZ62_077921 [Rhynchospora pubera]
MGLFISHASESASPMEDPVDSLLTKSLGSGKFVIEGSLSFKRKQETDSIHVETEITVKSPRYDVENPIKSPAFAKSRFSPQEEKFIDPESPKHEAAVKLQKVYKSFRTRRQLADCAVLVEQHWWKLLDFALLKRTSVSFFDINKPESAASKWSRAGTRVAKVGKGLLSDEKARKLALQHWLEAIDPRHRYGHNLHYYYHSWLHCESKQPFFYWLDVGEGKEVSLDENCPRSKLQQQCIKYLGPKEREAYEVIIEEGKLMYKQSRELIDTSEGLKSDKWIFVLSTSKSLYVGKKKKGKFQHSSFLAGGATSAAGRLVAENGLLKAVWPHSGHYRPTEENFQEFMSFLKDHNVDLTDVKVSNFTEKVQNYVIKQQLLIWKLAAIRLFKVQELRIKFLVQIFSTYEIIKILILSLLQLSPEEDEEYSKQLKSIRSELSVAREEQQEEEMLPSQITSSVVTTVTEKTEMNFEETVPQEPSSSLSDLEDEKEEVKQVEVPKEIILQRINSKKGLRSYQLGKQLSCKWSTGAGPRIGVVRDYPSELQLRALEEVSLSPRSACLSRFSSPLSVLSPRNKESL